jgi:uncharacterized YccA/Bax inhibitor family protein
MAPSIASSASLDARAISATKPTNPDAFILAAWAQGYMVGSIIIMAGITVANMRRGVLLHKLILLEVCVAVMNHLLSSDNGLPL